MSKEVEEYIKMSIDRYEALKKEEKLKIEQIEAVKDLGRALGKFIVNMTNQKIDEYIINEAMTRAGYTIRFEMRDGNSVTIGKGDKFLKVRENV